MILFVSIYGLVTAAVGEDGPSDKILLTQQWQWQSKNCLDQVARSRKWLLSCRCCRRCFATRHFPRRCWQPPLSHRRLYHFEWVLTQEMSAWAREASEAPAILRRTENAPSSLHPVHSKTPGPLLLHPDLSPFWLEQPRWRKARGIPGLNLHQSFGWLLPQGSGFGVHLKDIFSIKLFNVLQACFILLNYVPTIFCTFVVKYMEACFLIENTLKI